MHAYSTIAKIMKELSAILLLILSCSHSTVGIGGTDENLLNFAIAAIQNNGKAISKLADSLSAMRTEMQQLKSEFKSETDEIKSQILSLKIELNPKIQTLQANQNKIMENFNQTANCVHTLAELKRKMDAMDTKLTAITENRRELRDSVQRVNETLAGSSLSSNYSNWITIQRRGTPLLEGRTREKFKNRNWTEYENGFGSQAADFWIGLQKMHNLTEAGLTELRVDLEDWEGNKAYASYSLFKVAGSADNYRLTVSGYSGTAGDSMARSNGAQFSTVWMDNDITPAEACGMVFGPWWHNYCADGWLCFDYQDESKVGFGEGLIWAHWKGWNYSLKTTEMRIRRRPTSN